MLAVDTDAFVRTYNSRAYIFIYGKVLYAFTPENDDVFLDYAPNNSVLVYRES